MNYIYHTHNTTHDMAHNMTYDMSKQNMTFLGKSHRRRIGKNLLRYALLLTLLLAATGAKAQTNYVFYNDTYGYLYNDNGTLKSGDLRFDQSSAWRASGNLGNTSRNISSYTDATKYLNANGALGNSTDSWRGNGTYLQYRSGYTSYYFKATNATTFTTNSNQNNGNRYSYYTVTINEGEETLTDITINSGTDIITQTGTYNYGHSNAQYTPAYTDYYFSNTHHYVGSSNNTLNNVNATNVTTGYTWSLSDNATGYATLSNNTITVTAIPTSDISMTLTCSVTYEGITKTATKQVTIQGNTPSAPTISVSGTSVTMSTDAAGTTSIRYTLDGTDPTASTGTVYSGAIDLSSSTNSPVTIKAVTVRNGNASTVSEQTVTLTLPAPTITADGSAGTASISATSGATIYYTTDGSNPTTSSTQYTGNLSGLTMMTTIKAIAVKDGWNNSPVASETITIPSGTDGGTVTLFDYEDHKWSYYSDPECPVRSLSPADVKITYYGDGIVMTGNNDYTASTGSSGYVVPGNSNYVGGAKVNVGGENENTFIYYKTLERGADTQTAWTFSSGSQSSAASRCPYTPIPNPFQVRPTYGSRGSTDANDFTGWRGFQCWRLKNVTGGAVYSAASGGTALSTGAVINAETEIYFAPNAEYGMEVELEAVWARAYLVKGNQSGANNILSQNVGVERNFMTLTSGQNYRFDGTSGRYIGNKGYPVTISCYYPSGEAPDNTNSTISGYNDMTLGADTKFENVTFNSMGSYTLIAANHSLIVGRGCSGTVNVVRGINGNVTSPNYTLRIESGTYNYVSILRGYTNTSGTSTDGNSNTLGGTPSIRAIFGCDYDRATDNGITDKLIIENNIHYASGVSEANGIVYSENAVKAYIKSGKIGNSVSITNNHTAAAQYTVYMGGAANRLRGHRKLFLEGGEVASIAGGIDATQNQNNNSVTFRMTGGHVRGAVYGGGARSAGYGNRNMIVTGGTITGWFGGGCNGEAYPSGQTSEDTYGGITNGASKVYFGGNAICGGTGSNIIINGSVGGVVFGAGKGVEGNTTSGRMSQGTTVVIADKCDIERNVYGGGNFGYAQTSTDVYVAGGNVHGGVFGGSNQNNGPAIDIKMKGGTIEGGLYGGSNTTGTISSNVTMQIDGGQVGTPSSPANIHGGGYGQPTIVSQNVDITLGTQGQTEPGVTVYGDVYGGSALGSVNGTSANTTYHTNVTLNAGTINGSLYGGALGSSSVSANVYSPVTVTVNGGSVKKTDSNGANGSGAVYGCNNINGAPQRAVAVIINGTDPAPSANEYALFAVYGGGNQASYSYGTPTVTVNNCNNSIEYVYGGGNAAHITNGNTDVKIYGGNKIGNVFGGGNGTVTAANVSGNTNVNINGGTIGRVFGGSNSAGTIGGTINVTVNKSGTCEMHIDEVYGGGNLAASNAGNVSIGCTGAQGEGIGDVYGGANQANITGDISLNITGGSINRVFGGNNVSGSISGGIQVDVNWKTGTDQCGYNYLGSVFGAGNLAQYTIPSGKNLAVNILNGTVSGNVYGGGKGNLVDGAQRGVAGKVTGNPAVNIGDNVSGHIAIIEGDIYGGGDAADVAGTPVIVVNDCNTEIGYLYGGGNAADVNGTNITVNGGTIHNDAFGGGHGDKDASNPSKYADVKGNVVFNIYSGTFGRVFAGSNSKGDITGTSALTINKTGSCDMKIGEVYGGGNEAAGNAGTVTIGCTGAWTTNHDNANFTDNRIGYELEGIGTVYGGANQADIGTAQNPSNITLNINSGMVANVFGGNNTSGTINGDIEVNIEKTSDACGWYVGNVYGAGNLAPYSGNPAVNVKNGEVSINVYGGGKGATAVVTGNPVVTIGDANTSYAAIVGGDVYGGGDAAAVTGNTTVTYNDNNANSTVANLFGGGNAAGVSGTTTVDMTLGKVTDGIYGGCNASGSVGNITVNVSGGQVGTTTTKANIFGGGYGEQTATTGNVEVNIGTSGQSTGGATIYGDVYGGSALGNVNTDTSNTTKVNLNKGTIHGDAYGGGLGDDTHEALVNGNVTVTQNGVPFVKATTTDDLGNTVVTAGRIFGCNNLNGSPQGSVLVLVNQTSANPTLGTYDMNAVYGGGNLAPYNPATIPTAGQFTSYTKKDNTTATHDASGKPIQVVINGCDNVSVEYVYGGGNAAPTPCTDVLVLGAKEIGYLFGGGNGKDRYTRDGGTTWNANPGADVGLINGNNYGSGDANTALYGGYIHEAYGASNQKGIIKGNINLDVKEGEVTCDLNVEKIVGAGKNADVDGDIILVMGCMPADKKTNLVFGGADNANVDGDVELTITSGTFGKVFGGNNLGGIIKGHIKVNIEETGCNPIKIDELYLGGNEAAYSIFGYYEDGTLPDGRTKYSPRTSADDTHTAVTGNHTAPYAQPVLNVISCTYIGKVFGGGLGTGAAMYANPTVNINMVQGEYCDTISIDNGNNPNKLGRVENVYGGGNEAAVNGNTTVNIGTEIGNPIDMESSTATPNVLGAYIYGTVYGAGKGVATDPEAAIVTGNTLVNMAGGLIRRSIYGGGELGSVGTFETYYTASEVNPNLHPYHAVGEPKTCKTGTGLTKVMITGGQVGLVNQKMPDPANPTSDDDFGYVFCASKGIADSVTYNNANLLAVSGSSHLEITGGLVAASVYGGSENGQVLGDTYVKITGGQIGSGYYKNNGVDTWDPAYTDEQWTAAIDKIKAGTFTDDDAAPFHECDAWPFGPDGDRHVYDHYAGTAGYDAKGGATPGSDGHSYYGHVFGGGSGYYPFAAGKWRRTAGRVNGNTFVEITGGHILTNVYGGNEITDVLGHSKVKMTGGTVGVPRTLAGIKARPVNCYIFGAGMGDPRVLFNGWSNVASSEVIVDEDAVVFGSVFGGGEDGHVLGNSSTTIKGNALIGTFGTSSVDGNIFGSGRGFSAIALTAGVICGNVTVDIQENAKILGSVFGGGRLAAVGTYLAAEDDVNGNYGKLIPEGQDPYGTGSTSHGNVTINITGGTIGTQAAMSNPQYSVGDVFGGSKGTLMDDWAKSQMLGLVKNTTVNISQAEGYTTTIYGNVYGGGEIASVGSYNYATAADTTAYNPTHRSEPMAEGDVYSLREDNTGLATINITGGTIGQNSLADINGSVFGGCLGKAGPAYSGYSFVNNSDVTLNGGTVYGCVFGGGENGHVYNNTDVKIKSGTVGIPLHDKEIANLTEPEKNNMIYRGNVYGGGRGVDKTSGGDYSITAGKVAGNTNVTIEGGTIYRNVYGGGSLASVGVRDEQPQANGSYTSGLATVTIKGSAQIGTDGGAAANDYTTLIPNRENRKENGFVFGSGRGMAAGAAGNATLVQLAFTKNTIVNIEGTANVTGSVFGGGENGHVSANTKVYIKDSCLVGTELIEDEHTIDDNGRGRLLYRGNVYGGGRGIDKDGDYYSLTAGRVYGDTYVEVSGGKIYHDVFGGGSLASVGNETVNPTTGEISYGDESGETEVHINGGIIGYSSNTDKQGFNCGFVYGGCRGLSAPSNSDIVKMAYVHDTKVYIEPGADIKGSVFGGGANGHVKNDTYVEISGGSIGTTLLDDEVGFDDHGVAVKPVFRGNVYAGGRGVDTYQQGGSGMYSLSAGAVYGNAELKMTGGHVWHNIYGSGAMASVGTVKQKAAGQHVHDEVVDANGNLVNNVVYNPDESNINYLTGVFTTATDPEGETGTVKVTVTGGTVGDTTPGHEGRNNGRVYGAGRGVSADRSDYIASMEYVNKTFVTIGTENQQPSSYSGSTPDALNYPYIYGAVFGGGENGHVKTHTDVKIHSGIIGFPLVEGEEGIYRTHADGSTKNPYRGNVFGGGRGVDPVHHGVSSEQRSSSAGRVYGHTNVTMTGGLVRRSIYGGGLLASVGVYRLNKDDYMHITDMIEDEVDGGDATITITGGYIGNVDTDGSTLGSGYLTPGDNNGFVFGSSCGMVADKYVVGQDSVDIQYRQMGYTHSTQVSISGDNTQVFGCVFGSGENGHVWEDAIVNISGGQIGSNPTLISRPDSTTIYIGNVYGSGRGVDHPHAQISETAGKVRGNTTVNVTGGTIWRDVYGGGSLASVGEADETADNSKKNVTDDPTTNNPFPYSSGLTRVVVDGTSAVHGSVYGSGRGVASTNALYKQAAYVKNTLVTVKGSAHIFENVFGGGNAGHVRKNTDVTIEGSTQIDGNVYGGGAGDISSPTAGLVNHDVTVNIKGGLIAKDVYGGGAIANTNVHDVRNTAVTDCGDANRGNATTTVNLTGGIILGDAYGGGQGVIPGSGATAEEIANAGAMVQGDVTVTLNGTAFYLTTKNDDQSNTIPASGRVFGCNNLNGTPQGTVLVKVLQTKGVTESSGTYTVNDTKPTKDTDTYEVQAVYGGGNLAAYEPWDATATGQYTEGGHVATSKPLQVVIDGCELTSIEYVYGGGNAAATPSTDVVVLGTYEIGSVFGGGNGKDRITYDGTTYAINPGANVGYKNDGTTTYGNGTSDVYLFGGTIHSAFGGSNTKGNIHGRAEVHIDEAMDGSGDPICPLNLEEVYGGGNEAEMYGGSGIDLGCITSLKAIYGGAKNANVGDDIMLNITSGHYDRVFGGNNIGGTINGSITINIEETGCHPITIGELYGCGNQAAYTTPAGKTHPTINIKSFTSIGRVFGGGLGATAIVTGHPMVNINEVLGDNANENSAYAGATLTEAQRTRTLPDGTTVILPAHTAGKIGSIGTVFGGGNLAEVVGSPIVNVGTLTTVDFVTKSAAEAQPRTGVTVVGADITGNVFGGGNNAEVQGSPIVTIGK